MKKLFISTLLLLGLLTAQAQTNATDFLHQVADYYQGLSTLEMQVDYLIYEDHQTAVAQEKAKGTYLRNGENYFLKHYGVTMLLEDAVVLILDDSSKTIILSHNYQDIDQPTDQIGQYLNMYEEVEELEAPAGFRTLKLTLRKDLNLEVDQVVLTADASNHQVQKMTLFYRKAFDVGDDPRQPKLRQPRMEMVYRHFDDNPSFAAKQFRIDRYVAKNQNGELVLTSPYQDYEFIHQ